MRLYLIKPILIGSSFSQIISKVITSLIALIAVLGVAPQLMAQSPQAENVPSRLAASSRASAANRPRTEVWKSGSSTADKSHVLFYRDYVLQACVYESALLGGAYGEVTFTTSATTFAQLLQNGTSWSLVICANQNEYNIGTFQSPLIAFHNSHPTAGILISEWNASSASTYFPALGFAHSLPKNVYGPLSYSSGGDFAGVNPVQLRSAGWGIWNTGTITGGMVEATGSAASNPMIARNGQVIVNGFLSDTFVSLETGRALIQAEIVAITNPDTDGDGCPDATDGCPNDPLKCAPGACGCGVADTDTDGDGTANCNDGCPNDPAKTAPGICGCGVADTDSDGDGTANCNDGCPNDPAKTAPGICGCGVADTDSDGDGTADCNDGCPNDPAKTAPGICGCGVADTDSDGDGTANCNDGCPNDPAKTAPGICGCGVADTDTDGDGTADCNDGCPTDPAKTAPGICGCGVADTDTDGDGTADCNDNCVLIANPGQEDCNGNSIGDTCDIASGQALDCNGNSIPDSCDISSGTSADGDSDGIPDECEPTPAIQLVVVGSPSCVTAPGSEVSYELQVINPPFGLVAGQFFVEWDTTTFALIGVSAGDAPFNSIPYSSANAQLGRVFLIASVDGGGTGTSESRTVARLHFEALTVNCSPTVPQVRFMAALPQILTDGQGGSETLPLTNPIAVRIDGIAPVITGTPASITVDADAGPGCASVQVIVPPTASDNCEVVTFTFSRSDGEVITAPFPCGTTTMTWVATDSCGLSSTTSSTVTVNPFQAAMVEVQTNGATGNFQRCITFTLSGDGATYTTSEVLTFNGGIGSTQLRVPVGNYGCVTADDRLHTLSQQAELEVSGIQYVADFTGSNALLPGDLNNDNVVDVVDWGVLVVRIGQTASVNTNCETLAFHADFNADGLVNSVDGQLLLNVILLGGETCSSGAADGGATARQSISVKKLTEMGIANAESCDIDNNGIVDLFDMLLWQQKNSQN